MRTRAFTVRHVLYQKNQRTAIFQILIHMESPIRRNFETKFRIGLARSIFRSLHKITTYGAVFWKVEILTNLIITIGAKFMLKFLVKYPGWYIRVSKWYFCTVVTAGGARTTFFFRKNYNLLIIFFLVDILAVQRPYLNWR